jgi:hypothetical protein
LSFNDTGLSVSDGVTRNGLWDVDSADIDWEFSFDQGQTWARGQGSTFEVKDDGAKMIWVRARDDAGNTSEIVRVRCVLDTQAPPALAIASQREGATLRLELSGLEPGARWEYSLNGQAPWHVGSGPALGVLGHGIAQVLAMSGIETTLVDLDAAVVGHRRVVGAVGVAPEAELPGEVDVDPPRLRDGGQRLGQRVGVALRQRAVRPGIVTAAQLGHHLAHGDQELLAVIAAATPATIAKQPR